MFQQEKLKLWIKYSSAFSKICIKEKKIEKLQKNKNILLASN
jgi:hypothetical protein